MKYIFFGTPDFAAIILEKLINAGFIPEAIICNPDKPVGRKKIITAPAAKIIAQKYNIPVLQPIKISEIKNQLSNISCQLFIVAAYGKIIPEKILQIPKFGAIGAHPSLLPKYRGPSPIQTAILNGDAETGTTLFLMDKKMDHGKIISNLKLQISTFDNYKTLMKNLADISADLLIKTLPEFINKKIKLQTQDENKVIYTKKFTIQDAFINPEDLEKAEKTGGKIAKEIKRKIRAFNSEPGVWTYTCENTKLYEITKIKKRIKLLEAEIIDSKLKINKIQIEGKTPILI